MQLSSDADLYLLPHNSHGVPRNSYSVMSNYNTYPQQRIETNGRIGSIGPPPRELWYSVGHGHPMEVSVVDSNNSLMF